MSRDFAAVWSLIHWKKKNFSAQLLLNWNSKLSTRNEYIPTITIDVAKNSSTRAFSIVSVVRILHIKFHFHYF